jgi:hypothetical protein
MSPGLWYCDRGAGMDCGGETFRGGGGCPFVGDIAIGDSTTPFGCIADIARPSGRTRGRRRPKSLERRRSRNGVGGAGTGCASSSSSSATASSVALVASSSIVIDSESRRPAPAPVPASTVSDDGRIGRPDMDPRELSRDRGAGCGSGGETGEAAACVVMGDAVLLPAVSSSSSSPSSVSSADMESASMSAGPRPVRPPLDSGPSKLGRRGRESAYELEPSREREVGAADAGNEGRRSEVDDWRREAAGDMAKADAGVGGPSWPWSNMCSRVASSCLGSAASGEETGFARGREGKPTCTSCIGCDAYTGLDWEGQSHSVFGETWQTYLSRLDLHRLREFLSYGSLVSIVQVYVRTKHVIHSPFKIVHPHCLVFPTDLE